MGNVAAYHARLKDDDLIDCGLTPKGHEQARNIPKCLGEQAYQQIELVLSSPLTRALQTAVIAFPTKPVMVHYDLREFGGKTIIPENTPRKMKDVLSDLQGIIVHENLDAETLQPERWPRDHDTPPKVIRRDHIREVFQWIGGRPEMCVAVVCHYHVIRAALEDPWNSTAGPNVHPENGIPIACELTVLNGRVRLTILPNGAEPMEMEL
jgi:broad specificity phosphatase PhoE